MLSFLPIQSGVLAILFTTQDILPHLANNWATWESQAETAQSIFGRFWHLSKALGNRYGCLFYYHE